MEKEIIVCVKCLKVLTPNKDEIIECNSCHKKYCYNCYLDYTFLKNDDTIHCKECALEAKSDWAKPRYTDNTEQTK